MPGLLRNSVFTGLKTIGISGSQIQIKTRQAGEETGKEGIESSTHSELFMAQSKRKKYNNIKNKILLKCMNDNNRKQIMADSKVNYVPF